MPVPSAVISVPICSEDSILSVRTRSTFRILPRSGRTAWNSRLRPMLGAAAGRVTLDDEEFGLGGILFLAVGELARQRGDAERVLARQLARFSRGLAGGGGLDHLADDDLGLRRMFLEPGLQRLVDDVLDHGADFGGDQLVLGLRRELRVRHLHRQHGGETLAAVVAGERDLFLFRIGLGIAVDLAGQRAAEAGEMGAAVALRDVVGEAQYVLVVAVVPPQRGLDADAVGFRAHHDRRRHDRLLVAVEIFDEFLDAAVIMHLLALLDRVAHVREHDVDAGIEEGELAQPVLQRRKIVFDVLEGLGRGQESHFRAAFARGVADDLQRRHRIAMGELDVVLLVVAPDAQAELAGERVDDGDADAVQAAGNLVGVLVEFAAGMELGHDDLGRRDAFALVDVDGNAAAVVAHGHRIVGVEDDVDLRRVTRQRLVDRVVDDLIDHVVQAGTVIGVADIHARPLADGIEALQNPDRFRIVIACHGMLSVGDGLPGGFSHVRPLRMSRISCAIPGAEQLICAMKTGARLAQSRAP